MFKFSKLFLYLCMLSLISAPVAAENDALPETQALTPAQTEKKKIGGMRSWAPTPQKTKEKESAPEKTLKDDSSLSKEERAVISDMDKLLEEDEEQTKDKASRPLSPEEKLWKKYKDLAKKGKQNNDKAEEKTELKKEKDTEAKDEETNKETPDAENAEPPKEEKAATGIAAILEKYKKSQEGKGGMNSRSFGEID